MRLGIATDHGGFGLKEELVAHLRAAGHEVVDFGAHGLNPGDDYPDFVIPLAQAVVAGTVERGVAVCGSGVGASVCANKIPGVRAGLVWAAALSDLTRPGTSSRRSWPPSSVKPRVTCVAWQKWLPWSRK